MRLIDAEAFEKELKNVKKEYEQSTSSEYSNGSINGLLHALDLIKCTPTYEWRNEARWLYEGDHEYSCSECGEAIIMNGPEEFPFCPHCGARME